MPNTSAAPRTPKRRRLWQATKWSLLVISLIVAAIAGTAIYMIRSPIVVPEWLETRIEERFAKDMPLARIGFGEMVLIVDEGWRPRVRLRDVNITNPQGVSFAAFREVRASFSIQGLLAGDVQPRDIAMSGVVANLRRDKDGRVALSAASGTAPAERRAATMPQLIGQLDTVFETKALSRLRSIELRALTLRYTDLQSDRMWTVDGGRLLLDREGDNLRMTAELAVLGGGADVATLSANYSSKIGDTASQFGVNFDGVSAGDIAVQNPAFAWLKVLRASISGSVRSSLDEDGTFEPLNATLQIGAGVVQPNERATPIPFDGARSYFSYDPDQRLLRFDELSVESKWVSGRIEGAASLGIDDSGKLSALVAQLRLRDLVADPADIYDAPVSIEGADLDAKITLNPFHMSVGRMDVVDGGTTLNLSGDLKAGPQGWQVALDAGLNALKPERLLELWPENVKPKTRRWVEENVYAGALSDVDLAFRLTPGEAPQTYLDFDFRGAEVRFLRTMPNITKGSGHASLSRNRFVVSVDAGKITPPNQTPVLVDGSSFIMPDVTVKDGPPGIVRLQANADVTSVLSLLNRPPLLAMDKANLPVDIADATADLTGTLSFPMKKGSDPKLTIFDIKGTLSGVESDRLVKGRSLRVPQLSLTASNSGLTLEGEGTLDGVAFDGGWTQPFGKPGAASSVRADIALNAQTLETFKIALPPETVSGEGRAWFALDLVKGETPEFSITSDLRGLRVSVPQIGWTKPAQQVGNLEVSGQLGAVPKVESLSISAPGLTARGNVALTPNGALDRLRFNRLSVGGWLDTPVDLIGQGAGRPVQVVVRGGTLDMRKAKLGKTEPSGVAGPPMLLTLDRLQVTDTIALTQMKGEFDVARGMDGRFSATLNGGTGVSGRIIPKDGRNAVQLSAADAGGVLRSANIARQVQGGTLSLTLVPVGDGGAFNGRAEITDVRIKDAPTIAALVNAVSVVGLINELNGDGIYFDTVDADFRLSPDRVTLTQASATGASLGISMDGVFATDTGQMALQGVISPVYMLNGIASFLTRKGEGLLGFNYAIGGTVKNPSVSVNPLSGFVPGALRDIFRSDPPTLPVQPGEPQPNPVPPEPQKPVAQRFEGR
jgi:hypothetical protein